MLDSLGLGYRLAVVLGPDATRVVVRTMENCRMLLSIRLDDGVWGLNLAWQEALLVLDETDQNPVENGLVPFLEQLCGRHRASSCCGTVSSPDGKNYSRPLDELVKSAQRTSFAKPKCAPADRPGVPACG